MKSDIQLKNKIQAYLALFIGAMGLMLAGCKSTSVDDNLNDLTLQFQSASSHPTNTKTSSNMIQQAEDSLKIEGSNGILIIEDLRFIVEDFELERSDDACKDSGDSNDDCEEFEADPFFVDLPLQGEIMNLDTAPVESGLYEELEFEVDDLDMDEEEEQEGQQQKQSLTSQVRSEFPNWPEEASMVIAGSFISSQSDTSTFKTFVEAEVEIELEFEPPVEIDESAANRLVRVNINPVRWFLRSDSTVIDLSQYDFDRTGQVLELEVEIENGFDSVEVDDEENNSEED